MNIARWFSYTQALERTVEDNEREIAELKAELKAERRANDEERRKLVDGILKTGGRQPIYNPVRPSAPENVEPIALGPTAARGRAQAHKEEIERKRQPQMEVPAAPRVPVDEEEIIRRAADIRRNGTEG